MRTPTEIVAHIEEIKRRDFFGFETGDLIGRLDFEHAKPYLKDDCKPEEWTPAPNTRESILEEMRDYMPFAWEKANDCRGISAGRSMCHYSAWTWLLGDEEVIGDLHSYEHYGKDNLRRLCEHYGWDADQWDDRVRVNSESEVS